MIKLKERYEDDWRLYDTKTGKYVPNNPENRSRAMFCMMVAYEASKPNKGRDERYSVEEIANMYGTILYEHRHLDKITRVDLDEFFNEFSKIFNFFSFFCRNFCKKSLFFSILYM